MGFKDWVHKKTEEGREEIEEKVSDKLMEEQVEPTLRQHKGQPIYKKQFQPKDKEED